MPGHVAFSNASAGAVRTTACVVEGVNVAATATSTVAIYNGADNTGPPVYEGELVANQTEFVPLPAVKASALFVEATGTVTGVVHIS
jgi:hypothetical protein